MEAGGEGGGGGVDVTALLQSFSRDGVYSSMFKIKKEYLFHFT